MSGYRWVSAEESEEAVKKSNELLAKIRAGESIEEEEEEDDEDPRTTRRLRSSLEVTRLLPSSPRTCGPMLSDTTVCVSRYHHMALLTSHRGTFRG